MHISNSISLLPCLFAGTYTISENQMWGVLPTAAGGRAAGHTGTVEFLFLVGIIFYENSNCF